METININGEDYLIDIEKCKEQGLLKKKNYKPRSWEEWQKYVDKNNIETFEVDSCDNVRVNYDAQSWTQSSIQRARAFAAFGKLLQLRDAWIGDWEPNWEDDTYKYCIVNEFNKITVSNYIYRVQTLSFPTEEMLNDFRETFNDLIEEAKELI